MAALTFIATAIKDNTHDVVKSTDDASGGALATVIVDSTKGKIEVKDALRAIMRAVSREFGKVNAVADVPTTGTTKE